MNFCSHCGSDQISFRNIDGDTFPRYYCNNCGTIHYQNPRVVVGCIVVHEGQILLCRRSIEPRFGLWNLPGGYLENGETVEEGAIRETWEEAKARVRLIRLHSVYNLPRVNQVFMHFLAYFESLSFQSTPESSEVKLFPFEHIPWQELAFHSNSFALETYLKIRSESNYSTFIGTLE